jgi:hypothetical protein
MTTRIGFLGPSPEADYPLSPLDDSGRAQAFA